MTSAVAPKDQYQIAIDNYPYKFVTDEVWKVARRIIEENDPQPLGKPRANQRRVLEAILYRYATQCSWNRLPSALCDDSTAHRNFIRWSNNGTLAKIINKFVPDRCVAKKVLEYFAQRRTRRHPTTATPPPESS